MSKENKISSYAGVYSTAIGLLIVCIGTLIAWQRYNVAQQERTREVLSILEIVEQNIEETINESYSAALLLALTVNDNGEVVNFEEIASKLVQNHDAVDVLELVPDGVIEYVYPLEGHESVIGYNILQDPKTRVEVEKAMETQSIFFAGPLELKQGGLAVIGRLPILIDDKLWGYSAVLVYLDTIIERSAINEFSDRIHFQLSKVNPNSGEEEFFLPVDEDIDYKSVNSLDFPEGEWKLMGAYIGTNYALFNVYLFTGASVLISILISFFFYRLLRRPVELEILLQEKTRELYENKEQFRKNSELLTSVLESSNKLLIFSIDSEYKYLAFNKRHEEMVASTVNRRGLKKGDSVFDSIPGTYLELIKDKYDRALTGESFEYILDLRDGKGGITYWQNWFSPIYNSENNIIGITVFSNDITSRVIMEKELERKENRYRALISHSPYCIHELDLSGKLISINHAGLRMFGIENKEDFLGITYDQLLGEADSKEILELFDDAVDGKNSEFEFEVHGRHFLSSFVPIRNDENEVIRIMGMTQDITERKKSAEVIKKSLDEKTTLLSEIHHRVKNNLAIVSGLLELQKKELNDERLSVYIDQSIGRIISIAMVHELMYQTHDLSSVNVHSYLEMLVNAISSAMMSSNEDVEFKLNIEEYKLNINEAIPLGLMLNELVTNSFKYAFKGIDDKRISIDLLGEDDNISIVYKDNGRGFPDDIDFNQPKNLGLTLVHAQLHQLEADFKANTKNGFELSFSFSSKGHGPHSGIH